MSKAQEPWRVRVWREFHIANLTRASRDVLLTLQTYRGAGAQSTRRTARWPLASAAAFAPYSVPWRRLPSSAWCGGLSAACGPPGAGYAFPIGTG